ncbi:MAG: alkene reductase [Phycisphaerae bacterium]|nr:alkene reductase [Phycisphaerae bacterium]
MSGALFKPLTIGDITLENRVVLAPMTRSRAGAARQATPLMAEYYVQRASAGMILTEATVVSDQAIGWLDSPGIYTEAQAQSWKQVTEAVHEQGTPIFMQLWHCGRASHSSLHSDGSLPVSASAIKLQGDHIHTPTGKQPYETPRALETHEIPGVVEDYRRAADRALQAGFDGIEIHAANGYLLDQFLQSRTNHRSDAYGGSVAKRYRLLKEVVEAVLTVFPSHRVGVRLAPNGVFNDMGSADYRDQFLYVAKELNTYNLGYLHVMDGLAFGFHKLGEPMTLAEFREVYNGLLMGNCGYTQETAEAAVQDGHADLISFGRPYISNPDLVERFANGWPLAPEAGMNLWYDAALGPKGYTSFKAHQAVLS